MTKPFTLKGRQYGFLAPYLIAEIGVNHEGDLGRAKLMIEAAARGGAHAAKFQTYKAGMLATRDSSPAYWDRSKEAADSQFELFQRWDSFGRDEFRALARHCADCGIDFMSTPFDLGAVDLVASIAPAIKIASADMTNVPLLREVGRTGLPVILSAGASRLDEIARTLELLAVAGAGPVAVLHCVLNYPTTAQKAQLAQIGVLAQSFGSECAIGYSDHVAPDDDGAMPALEMAALLGAVVIEKHFTDNKRVAGNDHYHAMDEHDLTAFVARLDRLRTLHGTRRRDLEGERQAISNARRRIVAARAVAAGATLTEADLVPLRSNRGVEIAHWDEVIGRRTRDPLQEGEPLDWHALE